MNEIDKQEEEEDTRNHLKEPFKHFGQHFEYIYEKPFRSDQKPRILLSYDTIDDGTRKTETIQQMDNLKSYKRKKYQQSINNQKIQRKMKNPISEYIANFPQNSNNIKNLWKESENAQKRAQAEYKVIRELADEIFDQAKDEISKLPTFDISRFQKVFSAATGGYSGNGYDLNPFQSMNDKFHKQSDRHKILKNEKQKLKSGKVVRNYEKWHNDMIGHWIKKHLPKEPRNIDTSYELFGVLPKFDPRFPFDRAFKLMDDLQPPDMFKFSTNNFHI